MLVMRNRALPFRVRVRSRSVFLGIFNEKNWHEKTGIDPRAAVIDTSVQLKLLSF